MPGGLRGGSDSDMEWEGGEEDGSRAEWRGEGLLLASPRYVNLR